MTAPITRDDLVALGLDPDDPVVAELLRREAAQHHLADYARRVVGVTPAAHHRYICDELERGILNDEWDDCVICTPPGSAKALALDTPIPTPDGWTTMGALRVGDTVFDENGKPCDVTWVSPVWRNRPVYSVTTDCGDEIIADHDHEWLVRLCGKHPVFKIKETHQLHRKRSKRPMISRAAALDLPDAFLPIHPYLLGVWLGDGTSASMSVTSSDEDRPWMRSELERLGYETSDRSASMLFGVKGVRALFTHFGLLHDPAHNTHGRKHIPQQYLRGSYLQRLHLLQGLVDTDGTVCKDRGRTTFCNTNLELAVQVRELVRSLGVKAGWSESRAVLNGVDHGLVYRVSFYLKDSARLPRKARLTRDAVRTTDTCIDVVPAGRADTVCIEVDSPSHLFLCGRSMTPTHNSTYASHVFPAWFLGHFPAKNVILASHTASLAEKWSRRVRDTVASPEHSRVFADSALSKDSTAVARWSTSRNGEFLAAGVGMSILGFRADLCCVENTYLTSRTKKVSIADVDIGTEVLGYDEHSKTPAYGRVVAKRWRTTDVTYRVHTTDGHLVETTGNHPFFVRGCWKQADTLVVGDALLSMLPSYDNDPCIATGEVAEANDLRGPVLFSKLFEQTANTLHKVVRGLWDYVQAKVQIGTSVLEKLRWKITQDLETHSLQSLRKRISTEGNTFGLLFDGLQERGTLTENAGAGKSSVSWWDRKKQVSKTRCSDDLFVATNGEGTGQRRVRDLQIDGQSSNAPCGYGCDEQLAEEPGYSVQELSRNTSRCGKRIASETFISRIEVVRGEQRVWDIQVDELHNFAANSLILHNCVLDDPVSGWEEAQSVTQLQKLHDWFKADLKSRLKPSAKIIVICQRTAAYDMAGYLIKEYAENPTRRLRTIVLPMLAGNDDPLGRAPGDRLWSDWYTPEMILDLQKDEFIWRTMWQQEPPSDSGSWASADDIHLVDPQFAPDASAPTYIAGDIALSVNSGDYTVHLVARTDHDLNIYIVDALRERTTIDDTADRALSLCETYRPQEYLIDDDNASKVYASLLSRMSRDTNRHIPWKAMPLRGQDKETRAAAIRGWFKRGKVFMVKAPWNNWLVREILTFPNAVGQGVDDGIDCLSLLGRRIAAMTRPALAPSNVHQLRPLAHTATLQEMFDDRERSLPHRRRI